MPRPSPVCRIACATLAAASLGARAAGAEAETDAWDRVVRAHVRQGGVRYGALQAEREDLHRFLASLAGAEAGASRAEQLAFWINAYNAVTVGFVLERYPDLVSVRDVDGFFERQTWQVAGQARTLDEIEDAARALEEPRVHFALVCAAASCPPLRPEAYRPERLEEQLADQTRRFLADAERGLRYAEDENRLYLSSIFKWYAGDFTGGSTAVAYLLRGGLRDWVQPWVPAELARRLAEREPAVAYLDYDWSLNDR